MNRNEYGTKKNNNNRKKIGLKKKLKLKNCNKIFIGIRSNKILLTFYSYILSIW